MNLDAIKKQCDAVGALRQALHDAEVQIATVAGKNGQSTSARITVNGIAFDALKLSTAYMPEVVKGCEVIQREAVRLLTARRDSIRSQLDGAEWKLRQMTKTLPINAAAGSPVRRPPP